MTDESNPVPLFAELQRLLSTSSGPINWELARQTGVAAAIAEGDPPAVGDFGEAVRIAELQVEDLTGLQPPTGLPDISTIRRSSWATEAISLLPRFVEPTAAKVAAAMSSMQEGVDDAEPASPGPFGAGNVGQAMTAVMSLLQGVQAGSVIGQLATTALTGSDLGVPGLGNRLLFVEPNISAFESDWSLSAMEFRQWLAVREVSFRASLGSAWAADHLATLAQEAASTMEVDMEALQNRLERMDLMSDPEGLQKVIEGGDSLFDTVLDAEQRLKVARVQSFIAIVEGYAAHVTAAIAARILGGAPQIVEAIRRRDPGTFHVFPRLVGIPVSAEHIAHGRRFCDIVAEATDEATLAMVWTEPQALPSKPELDEPSLWMARSA